jgi:hypothetical protein
MLYVFMFVTKLKKQGKMPCFFSVAGSDYNLLVSSLPALNLATFFALILITAPV